MIEIDGIRRRLEQPSWDSGDYVSDEWLRMLDLTTHPESSNRFVLLGLASAIRRLNRNLATSSYLLQEPKLTATYDNVICQVNQINEDRGVGTLEPLLLSPSFGKASGAPIYAQ